MCGGGGTCDGAEIIPLALRCIFLIGAAGGGISFDDGDCDDDNGAAAGAGGGNDGGGMSFVDGDCDDDAADAGGGTESCGGGAINVGGLSAAAGDVEVSGDVVCCGTDSVGGGGAAAAPPAIPGNVDAVPLSLRCPRLRSVPVECTDPLSEDDEKLTVLGRCDLRTNELLRDGRRVSVASDLDLISPSNSVFSSSTRV